MKIIKPYLHRIFSEKESPSITEVWTYGPEESEIYGGFSNHQAIDFAVPTGTPVLAAADGFALASFNEVPIRYPDHYARTWHGEPIYWGYGLFIIILHENNLITVYGHLNTLEPSLMVNGMYVEPLEAANGDVNTSILELRRNEIGDKYPKIRVKAGQVIGYSGITGMGLGKRTFDDWKAGRPYRVNDEEHVHFAVSAMPGPGAEDAEQFDPFGIYGDLELYPSYKTDWSKLPNSLWLH